MATVYGGSKSGSDFCGAIWLGLKNSLVTEGWTVRGSGDGVSRFGDIVDDDQVLLANRGTGGVYDCWTVANTTDGVDGGAGNSGSWCWLRSPAGHHDLILESTRGSTVYEGQIAMSRDDSTGFVGGSLGHSTIPAVPSEGSTYEVWLQGDRSTAGSIHSNTSDTVHWNLTVGENEEEFAYWATYVQAGTAIHADCFFACMSVIYPHPSDPDPWIYGQERFNVTNMFTFWDWVDSTWAEVPEAGGDGITIEGSPGSYEAGVLVLYRDSNSTELAKGQTNFCVRMQDATTFGDRYTDEDTSVVYVAPCAFYTWNTVFEWDSSTDVGGLQTVESELDLFVVNRQPTGPTPDTTLPVVSLVSPSVSDPLGSKDAITFDVTDAGGFSAVVIAIDYPNSAMEVAWIDDAATPEYSVTQTSITNGHRYVVLHRGGWPGNPTVRVLAVDTAGNVDA